MCGGFYNNIPKNYTGLCFCPHYLVKTANKIEKWDKGQALDFPRLSILIFSLYIDSKKLQKCL